KSSEALIVTRGEHGSSVITKSSRADIAAVPPHRVVDPTGVGDAFRAGLMKGIAMGLPCEKAAELGSVAATYALEHLGARRHSFTWAEFKARHERHFHGN